jgi:3-oxoadipate enol-lactonase
MTPTVQLQSFSSRSLRLAYHDAGHGPAVLLLHGFPLSKGMWEPQIEALADRYRCLAPDHSGFGDSEPTDHICRMEDMAADAAALLDHCGIHQAVVCGLSMGGYAALAFCEAFPDRLRALVLADTRAGADDEAGRARRHAQADEALAGGSAALIPALVPKLLGARTLAERPDLRERVETQVAAAPAAGVAAALRGMAARPDRTELLGRIAVPTLVLTGEEDAVIPPEESRRLAQGIAGAELMVLPGAGHLSNLERPDAWSAALAGFLEKIS